MIDSAGSGRVVRERGGGTCGLRHIMHSSSSTIRPIPPTVAPTPIPALAPVDKPPGAFSGNSGKVEVSEEGVEALVVVVVDVEEEEGKEIGGTEGGDSPGLPIFHPIMGAARTVVASFNTSSPATHELKLTSSLGVDAYDNVAPDVTVDAQFPTTSPDLAFAR